MSCEEEDTCMPSPFTNKIHLSSSSSCTPPTPQTCQMIGPPTPHTCQLQDAIRCNALPACTRRTSFQSPIIVGGNVEDDDEPVIAGLAPFPTTPTKLRVSFSEGPKNIGLRF